MTVVALPILAVFWSPWSLLPIPVKVALARPKGLT